MKTISISTIPGFNEWRLAARDCLKNKICPENIIWNAQCSSEHDLFSTHQQLKTNTIISKPNAICKDPEINVSKDLLDILRVAMCHTSPEKFSLCYKVLWRFTYEDKNILDFKTDDDVIKLNRFVKAVRRDAYKVTAFLRFRAVEHNDEEHFIAWYEPFHYTLERVIPFFKRRFKNMHWSILMPYRAAHWDKKSITLHDNPDPSLYPKNDTIEQYWLTYYANIFNPARPKKNAMLSQMPKKYWKNMPETILIEDLLRDAEARAKDMINKG